MISFAQGVDGATITNKVRVATDFTQQITDAGTTFGAQTSAQSTTEIKAVNDTEASVTAAKDATKVTSPKRLAPSRRVYDDDRRDADLSRHERQFQGAVGGGARSQCLSRRCSLVTARWRRNRRDADGHLAGRRQSGNERYDIRHPHGKLDRHEWWWVRVSGNITGVTTLNLNNSVGNTTVGAGFCGRRINTSEDRQL